MTALGSGSGGRQICDVVFGWARLTPDKTAVVHNGQPLSYRDFATNIAAARGYFARRGCAGAGVAVLAVQNLRDFWILSLALRSLGLTTIAVPSSEFVGELGLPDVRCVVTSPAERWPGLADICAAERFPLLSASISDEGPLTLNATPPPDRPGGHVLLTSGTTAERKKVLMAPSFEPEYMRYRRAVMGIPQNSVGVLFNFGAWTGAGYKGGVSSLMAGATMVLDQRSERHLALMHPGVTYAVLVPGMADEILAAPPGALRPTAGLQIQVAGGALTQRVFDRLRAEVAPDLYNSLGSTETKPIAFTAMRSAGDRRWHRLVPDRGVEIVDEFDRPLPAGQVGRLRVTTTDGPTEYLHDPEATRTFFKHGYFYPGDLAVIGADGRMALHGRVTDVINVKGQKVSPAPIEDRLRDAFGVGGACLFSMQNESGEEEIHVIIEAHKPIEPDRLADILNRELRGFSGAHVHYVPALPRNDMGKLLRLPAREQALGRTR